MRIQLNQAKKKIWKIILKIEVVIYLIIFQEMKKSNSPLKSIKLYMNSLLRKLHSQRKRKRIKHLRLRIFLWISLRMTPMNIQTDNNNI